MVKRPILLVASIVITMMYLSACQTLETPSPSPMLVPKDTQDEMSSERLFIIEAWENGPHAYTYALSKGPNTYCARCHSPENWDPTAKIDEPPNCVSCKFPFENEMRIALSNPIVLEGNWKSISCINCHSGDEDDINGKIAWLNTLTGYHETVTSPTELCEKCHSDTDTLRHRRDLGDGAHSYFVCTDCHDAHSTITSCSDATCHANVILNSPFIIGHDSAHSDVLCVACHDASGLEVGLLEDQGVWVTFRTIELLGSSNREPYLSHNLKKEVDCNLCHYPDNPWSIMDEIATSLP